MGSPGTLELRTVERSLIVELRRYLSVLRRHALLVLVVIVAGVASGYAVTSGSKVYEASAVLFVQPTATAPNAITQQVQSDPIVAAQMAAITYSVLIRSQTTAALAVKRTNVPRTPAQIVSETTALPEGTTTLVLIQVKDADPAIAAQVANGMANASIEEIKGLETPQTNAPQPVSLFQSATVPLTPLPSKLKHNMELFGILGVIVAGALAMLLEYLDVTIRGVVDAQRHIELPVLGAVPMVRAING
jgi:capsular polysaccharide biosynthesis protein